MFRPTAETFSRHDALRTAGFVGTAALMSLLRADSESSRATNASGADAVPGCLRTLAPRAQRVIYLFQSGAPSQIDLFDEKPELRNLFGQQLPESVRRGQRLTGMTANQASHPIAPSAFPFRSFGDCGMRLSRLLPHIGGVADDICLIRSVHTDAINHDPAITFLLTGTQQAGRPSFGSWMSWGLGSGNQNLPTFVVMISQGTGRPNGQPLYERLWGSGFMPTRHQGVKFRSTGDPVLYLNNPEGMTSDDRRRILTDLRELNLLHHRSVSDPEIETRIAQYELAFRMQTSVPELIDVSDEPAHIFDDYGPDSRTPGTFAANCLLARRMAERGVRFIQLFHRGWDQHRDLPKALAGQCYDTDQASAALIRDLKQRGMLEDTLVIWG
ncbi:MAG: DUF1501 domain-containing protein, partial [Planctomycetaceae bacterium]|nr:DUF1501 domain-containing protein [Planctomycetaceae bacterium]